MGKIRDLIKKIRDTKGIFHAKMSTIKDRNGMDLTEAEDIKKRWQKYTEDLFCIVFYVLLPPHLNIFLFGPYHFCPLLCSSLHEIFPWYF